MASFYLYIYFQNSLHINVVIREKDDRKVFNPLMM